MRSFRDFFKERTSDSAFQELYDRECNICRYTVAIFEHLEKHHIDLPQLAMQLLISPEELTAQREADCCDPHLVIALCRKLGLAAPPDCPKLHQE